MMLISPLKGLLTKQRYFASVPVTTILHTQTCPVKKKICGRGSKGPSGSKRSKGPFGPPLQRAKQTAKCRMGFIPEEWFLFFHPYTGVTGPYVFGIVLMNYLFSKEIFVCEHEYYTGLSIILIVYFVTTRMGPGIGASLDKQVDAVQAALEKTRQDQIDFYELVIKNAKNAQWMADGQEGLIAAKRENVAFQLEAAYRERFMMVYNSVRNRMEYQVKRYHAEARIHQMWMIDWILRNVRAAITPEFEQRALDQAIEDLAAAASRA